MHILMLNPPFLKSYSRQSRSPCVTKGGTIYYPYYLAYATGALENAGYKPVLIDAVTREWGHKETVEFAKKENFDLIICESSTPSITNDLVVTRKLKEALPGSHITLVNTHPTNMPEWTLQNGRGLDSVCRGEYDNTAVFLAQALEKNKPLNEVPGISFRDNGGISHTGPSKLVENLDELPFVSEIYLRHFGEELIKKYFYASITWPEIQILTARGCYYNCSFCNIPMKKSYRPRSIKNAVDEFEFIQNNMPFLSEVMLEDDTFPMQKERTIQFCDALIAKGIDITWSCNARVNTDEEMMRKIKEAGCRLMCVGFESPTQTSLNSVIKGQTKDMQVEFKKKADKMGLLVNGCFILGLPTDTAESMKNTIEFAKFINPNTAQFYPMMVYPGTGAYAWAKNSGFLETEDFSRWLTEDGLHRTTVSKPELTSDDVLHWCNKARLEFYTNPKYLSKMIKQAALHPREAVRIAKGTKVLFRHMARYMFSGEARINARTNNLKPAEERGEEIPILQQHEH